MIDGITSAIQSLFLFLVVATQNFTWLPHNSASHDWHCTVWNINVATNTRRTHHCAILLLTINWNGFRNETESFIERKTSAVIVVYFFSISCNSHDFNFHFFFFFFIKINWPAVSLIYVYFGREKKWLFQNFTGCIFCCSYILSALMC